MRKIDEIIIHCTATPAGRDVTVEQIRRYHVDHNRWADIGYHYVVSLDGTVHNGRPAEQPGAHCKGHNTRSIGIAYVGGLLSDNRTPADTRTPQQKQALEELIRKLLKQYPGARVHSHRDFTPKACPCFDATAEYRSLLTGLIITLIMPLLTACHSTRSATAFSSTEEITLNRAISKIAEAAASDTTTLQLTVTFDSLTLARSGTSGTVTALTSPRATLQMSHSATGRRTISVAVSDTIAAAAAGISSATCSVVTNCEGLLAIIGRLLPLATFFIITIMFIMKTKR